MLRTSSGARIWLGNARAVSRRGSMFAVRAPHRGIAVKYNPLVLRGDESLTARLHAMLELAPTATSLDGWVALVLPRDLLLSGTTVVGFVSEEIKVRNPVPLRELFAERVPRPLANGGWLRRMSWTERVRAAAGLAHAVDLLHETGWCFAGVPDGDILVSQGGSVIVLGCDRMRRHAGVFDESSTRGLDALDERDRATWSPPVLDRVSLARHVFRLLFPGHAGMPRTWAGPVPGGHPPASGDRLGLGAARVDITAVSADLLPLLDEVSDWPRPALWHSTLTGLLSKLTGCPLDARHTWQVGTGDCPWCAAGPARDVPAAPRPWPAPTPRSVEDADPWVWIPERRGFAPRTLLAAWRRRAEDMVGEFRLSLGVPHQLPLTPERIDAVGLRPHLDADPDVVFYDLTIACTLAQPIGGRLTEATLEVVLHAASPAVTDAPIVWAMEPQRTAYPVSRSDQVSVQLPISKLGTVGRTSTENYTQSRVSIQSHGLLDSRAWWRFTPTAHEPLAGSYLFTVVVKLPPGQAATATITLHGKGSRRGLLTGKVRKRMTLSAKQRRIQLNHNHQNVGGT